MKTNKSILIAVAAAALFAPQIVAQTEEPMRAFIPVAGSVAGQHGANFRTELQINNRSAQPMSGTLLFRPMGQSASSADRSLTYELAPHATMSFSDVVGAFGTTGLGSIEIIANAKGLPVAIARAFDDAGTAGTKGVTIPAIRPDAALQQGETSALIAPLNRDRYRFNIGLRTLDAPVVLRARVYNASGVERKTVDLSYPATYFVQQSADAMLSDTIVGNETVSFEVISGAAIIYGTTTDNTTNDPSIQFAVRPE